MADDVVVTSGRLLGMAKSCRLRGCVKSVEWSSLAWNFDVEGGAS